jgi:hypothetical protein
MAAPGTPKACTTPSFSSTIAAAIAAVILAMFVSFELDNQWADSGALRH